MSSKDRLQHLDAIRALGVLLVVAYHTSYRFPPSSADLLGHTLRVTGWIGVDLFFALSGFLVTTILSLEANRREIGSFFRKRAYRIVPIFLVAILTFAAADIATNQSRNLGNLWKPLLFLTGYLQPFEGEAAVPYTITWSLSVEVTAYILLGVLAWRQWRAFKLALWVMVLVSIPFRVWLSSNLGWGHGQIGIFPPARLDALALGGLAALGEFNRLLSLRRPGLIYGFLTIGIIGSFRFAVWYPPVIETVGYSIFGLSAALWVGALSKVKPDNSLILRAVASIGVVSYFMYLFHLFFIESILMVSNKLGLDLGFWSAFYTSATLSYAAGLVSWRLFEKPLIMRSAGRIPLDRALVP